jgi:hypothetical protein
LTVGELIRGKKKPDVEKPLDLAEMMPDRDPAVATRQAEEADLVAQHDRAKDQLGQLVQDQSNADGNLRAQRLLRAEGSGPDDAVIRAKRERDRLADLIEDQRDLLQALVNKLVMARDQTREAQRGAISRAYAALVTEARRIVEAEHQHHEALIPLVARGREVHALLDLVADQAKRQRVTGCDLGEPGRLVLDGKNPWANAGAWITYVFGGPDATTTRGGALYLWRAAAIAAGLLEPTDDTRAEREREKQRQAAALVENAIRDEAIKAHLGRVWGTQDNRDLSMK